jgi:purine-binding chemotaxis protein CheW
MVSSSALTADEALPAAALPEWVVFSCEDRLFGVPLTQMREVVTPQPLTRLPGCGPEVGGLMGLRGQVVTVFDMGVVLGLRGSLGVADHRILVLDYRATRVAAIAVDCVHGIARDEAHGLPEITDAHVIVDAGIGVGDFEGKSFTAIDPNRILSQLLTS